MAVNSQGSNIRTETNVNGAWIEGDFLNSVQYQFNNQDNPRAAEIKANLQELADHQQQQAQEYTETEVDSELAEAIAADLRQRNITNFTS